MLTHTSKARLSVKLPETPAVTDPAGVPVAVMLVTVLKSPELVATPPAVAPVTVSIKAEPSALVPTILNVIPESLPPDVIVIFLAAALEAMVLTATPAVTDPAGVPTAVMLVTVLKSPELVAVWPALAPATISFLAEPSALVPITLKLIAESFPPDVIVTF